MKIDQTELRRGLAETQPYLLSHHEQSEWYRCYAPVVFGHRIRICARCFGIYPGILTGIIAYLIAPASFSHLYLVVVLPLPALADWVLTSFTKRHGYNIVRTTTGALLGYGYGLGIGLLFGESEIRILVLGVVYALAAGGLIILKET